MFLPQNSSRQIINNLSIIISDCSNYRITFDNFLNKKLYGTIEKPHSDFEVIINGTATTGIDIYEEYNSDIFNFSLLKSQTMLTSPGESLKKYHKQLNLDNIEGNYNKAICIMRNIPKVFKYNIGITEVHETAENAFALGNGVCQDFSHIMISLLRMENIPSRYVVGMMRGEGVSHAWVESFCNGYWYGFDPTNNKLVNDEYIKVSHGRDSNDCSVIRGSFYGSARQKQTEIVTVQEINS